MDPADSDRSVALAIVGEKVAVRFALSAAAFVDRLMALQHRAASNQTWPEHLKQLALDDLYLATACAGGDERAWQELDQRHFGFIRAFTARFLPVDRADEVASQLIADLWQRRKIAQYEGRSSLRTWLGAVVTRTAINATNARTDGPLSLDDAETRSQANQAAMESGDRNRDDAQLLAQLVRRALDRLDDEDKLLVLLHYEQELTLEQMQPAVGVSKATLSRRLQRVRERLQAELSTLLHQQTGSASIESLKDSIDYARLEFDLADALRGTRTMQGKRKDTV